jgi:hypothetical protein
MIIAFNVLINTAKKIMNQQFISISERNAFLKLPLEERRRILAEQAQAMTIHYQQDTDWQELQAGDLIEY